LGRRVIVALSVLTLGGLAACVANTANNPYVDLDAGDYDGALPTFDGAPAAEDGATPGNDAGTDSATPGVDGSHPDEDTGADTSVADSGSDVLAAAETGTDAEPVDSGVDATGTEVDSGTDATDAAPGADATDSAVTCVTELFGDYYLREDGTLVYFYNPTSQQVVMSAATSAPLATVTAVSAQVDHACALLANQTVWCWPTSTGGGNTNGDLGNGTINGSQAAFTATQVVTNLPDAGAPEYLTNVIAMEESSAATYAHPTCVIRSDATLWCWGTSTGDSSPPAGIFWGTTGSENAVPYAFPMASGPAPGDGGPAPLISASAVSVASDSLCYLSSGQVFCLGENVAGNLGNGGTTFEPYPVQVSSTNGLPATITALSSAYRLTCALGGGGVWCWGYNNFGQIGDPEAPMPVCGNCVMVPTPVQVALPDGGPTDFPDAGIDQSPLANVTQIASGYQESCGLDSSGVLRCWGAYNAGSSSTPEATPYNGGTAPDTNIAKFSLSGLDEDIATGVRYLTTSGALVFRQQVVTPICP
jgi:hypothetical protein